MLEVNILTAVNADKYFLKPIKNQLAYKLNVQDVKN